MTDVDQTFEDLRGNEMFPPGTPREYQRHWWEARIELLDRELRHAEVELAKLRDDWGTYWRDRIDAVTR